ncbi:MULTISPECIES: AEC family transporter [unclassified Neptuniibacter]|uniref:AEC family transporter n=1 Tax=unclassified Neptuniibacter TaxID=2630693 RepID=UPI0025E965E7|nr:MULTISPECIES: AEC family transporter [unclassified Neptuniibacter]|tara:strand:+ start:497 stop:1375 length:879 start_codon:yes stop_codon:yes gene_type:complete
METAIEIVNVLLPVYFIVMCGFFYTKISPTDMTIVNKLNMNFFVPALIFSVMTEKDFYIGEYVGVLFSGVFIVLFSGVLALAVARILRVQWRTFIPPMMFNNIGNLGVPVMVLAFGEQALPIAIVLFMVENLLHFTVGIQMVNPHPSLVRLLKNPIVSASLLGMFFSLNGWHMPASAQISLDMVGQISIPLMLFSLGVRVSNVDFSHWRIGVLGGLMSPVSGLIATMPIIFLFDLDKVSIGVLLIFASLPPAIMNYMVAEVFLQEPQKVASIVMIGNLLSVLVLPLVLLFVL